VDRFDRGQAPDLLGQLGEHLPEYQGRLDYITLAGSGEPTLNREMGLIIDRVKSMTTVPVAVLTNGTLLDQAEVRRDLAQADLVIPSLDTVRPATFNSLNQPHPHLDLERIIEGLFKFREEYRGNFWLEVLLVSGYNDSLEELEATRAIVDRLRPDRVQVNTVFRPPAYEAARAVSAEALEKAARYLGRGAEPVVAFSRSKAGREAAAVREGVLSTLGRRPCTLKDVAESLGLPEEQIGPLLQELEEHGQVSRDVHNRQTFYRRGPGGGTAA
jgi:wyosine [tRNA(Phe)-imidazoG37] synthetase (radical SAM superfamily)